MRAPAGEIRQGWPTKIVDQEDRPGLRKLGRPTWSTIFVDGDRAGEIRQGLPTKTADQEGAWTKFATKLPTKVSRETFFGQALVRPGPAPLATSAVPRGPVAGRRGSERFHRG